MSVRALLLLSLLATGLPAQERHVHPTGAFSMVIPAGWRQLTPDEALRLSRAADTGIPFDLLAPTTAELYPYGAIDAWLAGRFDGRAMTVQQVEGECPTDKEGVAIVSEQANASDAEWTRQLVSARPVELGPERHPAIECVVREQHVALAAPLRALVLHVPSGGSTFIVSFRTWEADFAAARAVFEEAANGMIFARAARGPAKLGDRLLPPIVVGLLVWLLLLVLRQRSRPAPS